MATFAVLGVFAVQAQGQMSPNDSRLLPYAGTLQTGAAAAVGSFDFRFALFATEGGAADCLVADPPGSCGLWWDQFDSINVVGGQFNVALGRGANTITDVVLAQQNLYIAIAVREHGALAFTLLTGKQRILAVPWAARAAAAKDYKVTGALTVGGSTTLNGDVTMNRTTTMNGDVGANANMYVPTGTLNLGSATRQMLNLWGTQYALGVQASTLYLRTEKNLAWYKQGTHDDAELSAGAGGTKLMTLATSGLGVYSNIYNFVADGELGVTNNFFFRDTGDTWLRLNTASGGSTYADLAVGNMYVNRRITFGGGPTHTSTITAHDGFWGGWTGWVYCPASTYVCGMRSRVEGDQGGGDDTALNSVQLACCPFGP